MVQADLDIGEPFGFLELDGRRDCAAADGLSDRLLHGLVHARVRNEVEHGGADGRGRRVRPSYHGDQHLAHALARLDAAPYHAALCDGRLFS